MTAQHAPQFSGYFGSGNEEGNPKQPQNGLVRGASQTASGGRLQRDNSSSNFNNTALMDSQNIMSSGNVINNNFNIVNNFMGMPENSQGQSN